MTEQRRTWTVGQVAERTGVTIRTLRHYDDEGIVRPARRSPSGYRLYDDTDVARLARVVRWRRQGFALGEIAVMLTESPPATADRLRARRDAVMAESVALRGIADELNHEVEIIMSAHHKTPASDAELREVFGAEFDEFAARADEAKDRWGDTDVWAQSAERKASMSKDDWAAVKAEQEAVNAEFAAVMASGAAASSGVAMAAAERHRRAVEAFYDCTPDMHRNLGDMYVADERFAATYEAVAPGLARYIRDAIHANADRHE